LKFGRLEFRILNVNSTPWLSASAEDQPKEQQGAQREQQEAQPEQQEAQREQQQKAKQPGKLFYMIIL
jgi:uncharacterized membrane protein YukC